jgi:hypothetical protein
VASGGWWLRNPELHPLVLVVDVPAAAADPVGACALEPRDRGVEGAGQVVVVAVDVGDELAGGSSQTLVEGVGLPTVGLGDPPGEAIAIALDDLRRTVGRAPVDDDVLQIGVALVEDGVQGSLDERSLVERGRDYAKARADGRDDGRRLTVR